MITKSTPVIFVHGKGGDSSHWSNVIEHFRNNGYWKDEIWVTDFDTFSHDSMVNDIDKLVDHVLEETAYNEVNLVGHSLGSTAIRYWMEMQDRYNSVNTVVYLAGALHGTKMCKYQNILPKSMSKPCDMIGEKAMTQNDNVLSQLNEGDECPGDVTYYTIRASFDKYFYSMPKSPTLKGAVKNVEISTTHRGLLRSSSVNKLLIEWLYEGTSIHNL